MRIVHLLKAGEFFAFDSESCEDGDVLYAEVLAVHRHVARSIDYVGRGGGGYRVLVHCAADSAQGTLGGCIRLSSEQMRRAREAGWPAEKAFLRALLAIA
jgi:hypothetical protein